MTCHTNPFLPSTIYTVVQTLHKAHVQMAPLEILISGGGVAGFATASFLLLSPLPAGEKPHVTIVERASEPRAQGQNIDIRGEGLTVIRKLGLETAVRSSTTGEEGVKFVDKNNAVWATFAADKSGKVQTGTSDIEILRGTLTDILYRRCKNVSDAVKEEGGPGVDFIFGDYAESIDQDGPQVGVKFAKSGARKSYDFVIGADGLQSQTRKIVWGEEDEGQRLKSLDSYGAFWSMPAAPTDSLWRRWFHAPGSKSIMIRPSDTPDRTTVFMNIYDKDDPRLSEAATFGHKGVLQQKALMRDLFRDEGWECERILDEMDNADDFYYDIIAQVHMPDNCWHKGRVALVGDAGYCGSPFSGMGTTLALVGSYNLAGALSTHPDEPDRAFAAYEQEMGPLVEKAQKLVPGAPKILLPETSWGLIVFRCIVWVLWRSGLGYVLAMLKGPPANAVSVRDFGFEQLAEWKNWRNEKK